MIPVEAASSSEWGSPGGAHDSALGGAVHGGDKTQTVADYKECMGRQPTIPDSDPGAVGKRSAQENRCLSEANQRANSRDQQRGYEEQQKVYQGQLAAYNTQLATAAAAEAARSSGSSGSSAATKAVATDAAVEVGAGLLATVEIWLPALIVISIVWIIVCVAIIFIAHWWWPGWSWEASIWTGVIAFFAPMLILGGLGLGAYLIHRSHKKKKAA